MSQKFLAELVPELYLQSPLNIYVDHTADITTVGSQRIVRVSDGASAWADANGDGSMDLAISGNGSPTGGYGMFLLTSSCVNPMIYDSSIQTCSLCQGIWISPTACDPCPTQLIFSPTSNNSCVLCKGTKIDNLSCKPCASSQFFNLDSNSCEDCNGIVSGDMITCTSPSSSPSSSSNIGAIVGGTIGGVCGLLLLLLPAVCILACCCCFLIIFIIIFILIVILVIVLLIILVTILSASLGIIATSRKKHHDNSISTLMDQPIEANQFSFQYREIPYEELMMKSELGKGASGNVYKGLWRNVPVAIKSISLSFQQESALLEWRKELEIMTHLGNHPNILPFIGACTTQPSTLYIITKLCDLGSLYSYLIEKKKNISTDQLYSI